MNPLDAYLILTNQLVIMEQLKTMADTLGVRPIVPKLDPAMEQTQTRLLSLADRR